MAGDSPEHPPLPHTLLDAFQAFLQTRAADGGARFRYALTVSLADRRPDHLLANIIAARVILRKTRDELDYLHLLEQLVTDALHRADVTDEE